MSHLVCLRVALALYRNGIDLPIYDLFSLQWCRFNFGTN